MSRPPDARTYDLDALQARVLTERGGAVDDSIPELAAADPDLCALALALPDGEVRSTAQADVTVSVQSAVKPFLFALALLDTGGRALDRIGIEPTGEAFDAIKLESGTGRPPNPMVNAGALLTASLVDGDDVDGRTERILRGLSAFAARDLQVEESVARSEHLLGDRNHALAHLMRAEGTLRVDADDAVAVYARACAVLVDARSLAVMGATLALGGLNPVSGERVVPAGVARDVVSVMATCGVYDGSGRWMRSVGVPAKSGVSGAIVLSAPDRLGAAVVSPPLDEQGTSVRGARASEALSADLDLHVFGSRHARSLGPPAADGAPALVGSAPARDDGRTATGGTMSTAPGSDRSRGAARTAIRLVAALALAVSAGVHLVLALDRPPLVADGGITLSGLFLGQGVAAAAAAAWLLLRDVRAAWLAVLLVAAPSLAAVLLSVWVRVPAIGPLPPLYEPVWYTEKTVSAVTAGVATLAALVGVARGPRSSGGRPRRHLT